MIASVRRLLTAGAFAALTFAPAALRAQATAPDSLAFPRQFVKWVFTTQGDSAFAHAGPELRGGMKSAQGVNDMSARIALRFGEMKGTDDNVNLKVSLIDPVAIEEGLHFAIREGGRTVGAGVITKINL